MHERDRQPDYGMIIAIAIGEIACQRCRRIILIKIMRNWGVCISLCVFLQFVTTEEGRSQEFASEGEKRAGSVISGVHTGTEPRMGSGTNDKAPKTREICWMSQIPYCSDKKFSAWQFRRGILKLILKLWILTNWRSLFATQTAIQTIQWQWACKE